MSEIPCCPTCGALTPRDAVEHDLSRVQLRMYRVLRRAGRLGANQEMLIAGMYGGRDDGGPLSAAAIISVAMPRFQSKLARHGLRIVTRPARGRTARRYLEKLP